MSASSPALLGDLRAVGVPVSEVWQLVNTRRSCRAAIPVLIDWIQNAEARVPAGDLPGIREALVRSLTIRPLRVR